MAEQSSAPQPTAGAQSSEYKITKIAAAVLAAVGLALIIADMIIKAMGHAAGLPGGTEFGGTLLGTGLPILIGAYAVSRGIAKGGIGVLLIALLLSSGCGITLGQQLGVAQTSAVAARKAATAYYDPLCLTAAKACPARPAACPAYDACDGARHRVYQVAAALQVALRSAAAIAALDEKQGIALLPAILAQLQQLWLAGRAISEDQLPASKPAEVTP